jgi:hypothetical protein
MSKQTIETMTTSLRALEKMIDTMKKDKKADKKKLAELQKEQGIKAANIAKKFNEDMKTIKGNFTTSSLLIEKQLAQSAQFIQAGKKALDTYLKTRDKGQLLVLDGLVGTVKQIFESADAEMNDFGGSWNEYRELNTGVDPKLVAEGSKLRTDIIETTKSLRAKVKKMESAVAEAEAIKKQADNASSLVLKSPGEKLKEVQDLVRSLMAMDQKMRTGTKQTIDSIVQNGEMFKTNVAGPINDLKNKMKILETQYTACTSVVQGFTTNVTTMKKVLAAGKSTVEPMYLKDNSIVAVLRQADGVVTTAEADVKKAQTAVVDMAKELNKAKARVKTGK